jgi:hypothetical protein
MIQRIAKEATPADERVSRTRCLGHASLSRPLTTALLVAISAAIPTLVNVDLAHATGAQLPYELQDGAGQRDEKQSPAVMDVFMRFDPSSVVGVEVTITLETAAGEALFDEETVLSPEKDANRLSGSVDMTLAPGLYVQHITGNVFVYDSAASLGLDLYRYLEVGDGVRVLSANEYSELAMPTTKFVDQYGREREVQFVDLPADDAPTEEVVEYTQAVPDQDGDTHDTLMAAKARAEVPR